MKPMSKTPKMAPMIPKKREEPPRTKATGNPESRRAKVLKSMIIRMRVEVSMIYAECVFARFLCSLRREMRAWMARAVPWMKKRKQKRTMALLRR